MVDPGDRPRFSTVMVWLSKKYSDFKGVAHPFTEADQRDYFKALRDIPIEKIEWAADWHFGRSKYFPLAAHLREGAEKAPNHILPPAPAKKQLEQIDFEVRRQHNHAEAKKLSEALDELNRKYGTNISVK
jgi:hypothetical protein